MENIIEIRNRRITINTDMHREDYCKPAILFEVLDGSVTFSYVSNRILRVQYAQFYRLRTVSSKLEEAAAYCNGV
jgi:hypothetical protein